MGVNDVLEAMTSPKRADACLESILLHLSDPNIQSGQMCVAMLEQVTPLPRTVTIITAAIGIHDPVLGIYMAVSEYLLGQEFWDLSELCPVAQPCRWI